jgi:predicted RNA-binding Zn-ribbon protein involved in translation (DUF1610 family)
MKSYTRVETKDTILLGVVIKEDKVTDPREGTYTIQKLYCINCNSNLTNMVEYDNSVNYCPYCGLDLIGGRVSQFPK